MLMIDKTVNITNFIGIYDNYITKEECNRAIKLYEDQNKFNKTVNRLDFEQAPILQKQDQQCFPVTILIAIISTSVFKIVIKS